MFMALFPGLVYGRLEENTRKEIESSSNTRRTIFESITVGINVHDTDIYQKLAEWLLKVPEEKLKTLTMKEVIEEVGEYRSCGYLV